MLTTWTVIAVLGVGVSGWSYVDGFQSLRWLRQAKVNSERHALAKTLTRSASASFFLHAFFLLLGAFAYATPPTTLTPAFVALSSGYILVAASNVRAVGLNQLDRYRLRRGELD